MTRLLPKVFAMGGIEVMCAHGIPERSTSFVIAAPQRVQDPHVETMIAASTPALFNREAISRPKPSAFRREAPVPTVV
jgi:hypothetical protein